ncbi:hypothetical protein [Streptomyces milbemycinicus]|uniref:Uncharacterized protein n=1 Tax=Streptomyces milbemycinicus TaxID=476552 RepID=A0ABW8LVB7_9ACTN
MTVTDRRIPICAHLVVGLLTLTLARAARLGCVDVALSAITGSQSNAVDLHGQKTTSRLTENLTEAMLPPCEIRGRGRDLAKLLVAWVGNDAEV